MLLKNMGDSNALILRNHGLLVATSTIAEGFNVMQRLEQACRTQLMAMACGEKLHPASPYVIEETWRNNLPGTRRPFGVKGIVAINCRSDRRPVGVVHVFNPFGDLADKSGKIRPLAVTPPKRPDDLPKVPSINESGYKGFDASTFRPAGTVKP
jgi:hypothetical protein